MKRGGVSELVPVCLRDSYVSCVYRCLRRSLVGYPCMCFACLRDMGVCVWVLWTCGRASGTCVG